ncbi:MAG TPA: AraC family transcriptional regulator [Candidatus Polarisedimenticolia bacterium]|nr:AraC family transcriptional regulator [Candidatus Polarisedimenticolia bacterium]
MSFHEQPLAQDLTRYVQCLWTSSFSQPGRSESVIVPDGCVEIVYSIEGSFHLAGRPGRAQMPARTITVLGLATRALGTMYRGPSRLIGLRLTPAGAMRLFPDGLRDLVDGSADGEQIFPALTRRLAGAVEHFTESGRPELLNQELRTTLAGARFVDPRVEHATSLLHSGSGPTTVAGAALEAGVSTRRLDRCFDKHFGISPKLLYRVARFQRAFSVGMLGQRGDWADVAARCGYSDQSHLSREFFEFTDQTPERMRAAFAASPPSSDV